jgi:FixJ family two-component response regulator
MASEHKELSDQDELIADLLGQGWTHRRVADSVGVSSKTVQRRMSDPAFSMVVSERRRDRFGQLSGQLRRTA